MDTISQQYIRLRNRNCKQSSYIFYDHPKSCNSHKNGIVNNISHINSDNNYLLHARNTVSWHKGDDPLSLLKAQSLIIFETNHSYYLLLNQYFCS